ncbi:MAG: hypothetical protein WCA35_21420 [Kovacikia sp.]
MLVDDRNKNYISEPIFNSMERCHLFKDDILITIVGANTGLIGLYLPKQWDLHQITSLALDESSLVQLAKLPPLHRDPFDGMLITLAI